MPKIKVYFTDPIYIIYRPELCRSGKIARKSKLEIIKNAKN